jgi:hypothetical protein
LLLATYFLQFGNEDIIRYQNTLKAGNGEQLHYRDVPSFMEEKHLSFSTKVVKSLLFTYSAPTLPYILLKKYI